MQLQRRGLGDLVPAVVVIPANPVLAAVANSQSVALSGLGCACDGAATGQQAVAWQGPYGADARYTQQGRDMVYSDVGLSGVGDVVRAKFPLPWNPINNALARSLAGLNGVDLTSPSAFMTSVQTGTSFGVPNWALGLGAVAALWFMSGGGRRR